MKTDIQPRFKLSDSRKDGLLFLAILIACFFNSLGFAWYVSLPHNFTYVEVTLGVWWAIALVANAIGMIGAMGAWLRM